MFGDTLERFISGAVRDYLSRGGVVLRGQRYFETYLCQVIHVTCLSVLFQWRIRYVLFGGGGGMYKERQRTPTMLYTTCNVKHLSVLYWRLI